MSHKRHKIKAHELQGFKYFKAISEMVESLHRVGCERDRAGNRILHMNQYVALLLLNMFNPICTSLRALQQAGTLKKVQRKLGVPRASLASLSEAATVFDSQALIQIIEHLGTKLRPIAQGDQEPCPFRDTQRRSRQGHGRRRQRQQKGRPGRDVRTGADLRARSRLCQIQSLVKDPRTS